MRSLTLTWLLALGQACSSETARAPDDDRVIVPEGLAVTALPGGNGVLNVIALSLSKAAKGGVELYAAVRNEGVVPACHAALSVELFDKAEQSLAAGISGLLAQHFYQLTDNSGSIAACIGPGDVTMAAVLELSSELALEDVAHVVYRCPYFALDVIPVAGLEITQLMSVGGAYAGTLRNGLDVPVQSPSVSVFALAHSGRPLGMISASDTSTLAAGETWAFQTGALDVTAAGQVAFPAGALATSPH
jgi:hypothetical protein